MSTNSIPAGVSDSAEGFRAKYEHIELKRQRFLLYLFNGVGAIFLIGFAIAAVRAGRTTLAAALFLILFLAGVSVAAMHVAKSLRPARRIAIVGSGALYLYLVATGGVNNTGLLWCYPLYAVIIVLTGVKRGLPVTIVLLLLTVVAFTLPVGLPGMADYPQEIKLRFLASMFALGIFVALTEYARSRNQVELLKLSAQLDELSSTDMLTGLPNRRALTDFLLAENSRRARHGRPFSIIYGDVDDFKRINDTYGHDAGDAVLKAVAQCMRINLRDEDMVGRWGGEEFLIAVPEADETKAWEVAERLRNEVSSLEVRYDINSVRVTMSFGVETVTSDGRIEDFISRADKKLLTAKRSGKNRSVQAVSS
jgi:diguanylate cyclase (GGDEF)-like protein